MPKRIVTFAFAVVSMLAAQAGAAAETRITWHGHATFEVVTPEGWCCSSTRG